MPHSIAPTFRFVLILVPLFLLASNLTFAAESAATSTMAYANAVALEIDQAVIRLEKHASIRSDDWDQDGDLDLLAGDGTGKLWLIENEGTRTQPLLARKTRITAGTRTNWGNSLTGVVRAQVVGDALPDLVVGHSKNRVTIHRNVGSRKEPRFEEQGTTFEVQSGCDGRLDVADWDGDGKPDLITGSFGGTVQWHRNTGSHDVVSFSAGEQFCDIRIAYNSHPRLIDFDHDGELDLLLGLNWGSVTLYRHASDQPDRGLQSGQQLKWSNGKNLNIRELNGDDTTPELCDWDGDGVLDLISGGRNGKIFWMKGISFPTRVLKFKQLLAKHNDSLGESLLQDSELCEEVFGCLTALQADLQSGLIPSTAREKLFDALAPLAKEYPRYFTRQHFDLNRHPHLPILAAQYWVVLLESIPDSSNNRRRVADALGFSSGYRTLLTELGVIFIDNNSATPQHLKAMINLMREMPRATWEVETITVAGWLGPVIKKRKIRSRSGVNIFDLPLGRPENSFAADSPRPGITDVYLICLAHELAHNMLDTVGRKQRPDLYERKFSGLAQAAGPHVVYHSPASKGIDFEATKAIFRRLGAWDGRAESWRDAWVDYFADKREFDRAYSRGNIQFFLDSPQEAFATLANQYYADSALMLEFCKKRWDTGHRTNINQFLLIAEYLSEGKDDGKFFQLLPGGKLSVNEVQFARDARMRIQRVRFSDMQAEFDYGDDDLVTKFELKPWQAEK